MEVVPAVRCLKDPTRGGLATSLNEIALSSEVALAVDEPAVPVLFPAMEPGVAELHVAAVPVAIETRRIAVLASNGVDERSFGKMKKMLESRGAMVKVVAPRNGKIMGSDGNEIKVDETFVTTSSVLFDAVYLPGGAESADELLETAEAIHFVDEAFKHCKAIAAEGDGVRLLDLTYAGRAKDEDPFVFAGKGIADGFVTAIAAHRNWERELRGSVPA